METKFRIGMVGHGYIGRSLYQAFEGSPVKVVSVYDRLESNFADLPPTIATTNADAFFESLADLDLVVEVAHPDVSTKIGVRILNEASYMPCSVVALADETLKAATSGRC